MIAAKDILAYVDAVVERFAPRRVILFGSYAYGVPTADSDIDLLIEKTHRGQIRSMSRIRRSVDAPFALDLLVFSPAQIKWRLEDGDMVLVQLVEEGLTLYEADNPRVGQKGRRRLRQRLDALAIPEAQPV